MSPPPVSQTLTGMWIASCPLCPWLGGTATRSAAERMQQTHLDQHRESALAFWRAKQWTDTDRARAERLLRTATQLRLEVLG